MLAACLCAAAVYGLSANDLNLAIGDVVKSSEEWIMQASETKMMNSKLAAMFNNTYTFTATRTWSLMEDGTVFVHTGDIKQMWLRDSSQQMRPYLPLAKKSERVSAVFSAVFKRMARFFVEDQYASAFNQEPQPNYGQCPPTLNCLNCSCINCAPSCSNHTYKHNYEMDSFLFVVDLVHQHFKLTGERDALDPVFHDALRKLVKLLKVEQDHQNLSPYRFGRHMPSHAVAKVGLLWGFSRPSDDDMQYNYNIPDNMLAVVVLEKVADLALTVFQDAVLEAEATELMQSVDAAIQKYGIFKGNKTLAPIYAFEVDGFGNQILCDDANLPNLLSIPYIGYHDKANVYQNTRRFVLRPPRPHLPGNPNYFVGTVTSGLGSNHTSHGLRPANPGTQCDSECIWPLGLLMEAITSTKSINKHSRSSHQILDILLSTDANQSYMHEGFSANNCEEYNRDYFGWANSLFADWILNQEP